MRVPTLSIAFIIMNMILGIAIPIIMAVILHVKYKADGRAFFVGILTMIVFALVLEQILHTIILSGSLGDRIKENIWLYAVYGGLAAGIFEETGRLVAFKTILRSKSDKKANSVMYGIGHGGIEMFVILVIGMVNNLICSLMINSGHADKLIDKLDKVTQSTVMDTFKTLADTNPSLFAVSACERIIAFTAQIALSVIVWYAATHRKKFGFFFLAILMHMLLDTLAAAMNQMGINVILIEVSIAVLAVLYVLIARRILKKEEPLC